MNNLDQPMPEIEKGRGVAMTKLLSARLGMSVIFPALLSGGLAFAQDYSPLPPSAQPSGMFDILGTSENGVDLITRDYTSSSVDLTIGSQDIANPLQLIRSYTSYSGYRNKSYNGRRDDAGSWGFAAFGQGGTHNFNLYMIDAPIEAEGSLFDTVVINGQSYDFFSPAFDPNGGWHPDIKGSGVAMKLVNNVYQIRLQDGTVAHFPHFSSSAAKYCTGEEVSLTDAVCILGTKIEYPNGSRLDFSYESLSGDSTYMGYKRKLYRLSEVVNSRGFGFRFQYRGPAAYSTASKGNRYRSRQKAVTVSSVSGFIIGCDGVVTSECANGALPTVNYNYDDQMVMNLNNYNISLAMVVLKSVVNAAGDMTSFQYTLDKQIESVTAGDGSVLVSNQYGNYFPSGSSTEQTRRRVSQQTVSGRTILVTGDKKDVYLETPSDGSIKHYKNGPYWEDALPDRYRRIEKFVDGAGEDWLIERAGVATGGNYTETYTLPEGNKVQAERDNRGNYLSITSSSKPGAAQDDLVETRTYAACTDTNYRWCNSPVTITDPAGQVTNISYSPSHGGPLYVLEPGVNGVQPAAVYSYIQRYPWVRSAGGTYIQSDTAIWLVSEKRSCRSTTMNIAAGTCGGGTSDLVTVQYDYGPDSGPNHLWLKGVGITADGQTLRECYSYDVYGNMIEKNAPHATPAICP